MKLQNEHVFVTGGASGIGAAIVLDAVQQGARVSFCDIVVPAGEAYAAELTAQGFKVMFHQADVGKFDSLKTAHDAIVKELGPITGLVNNAGVN